MPLKKPESMDECHYFTSRTLGDGKGRAMAWVFRKKCSKCDEGAYGIPIKPNGKPDRKAEHFECSKCGDKVSKEEAEKDLIINIEYKCHHCGNEGETTTEYKRKPFRGVPAYVFSCGKCSQKIGITKKMKETKK